MQPAKGQLRAIPDHRGGVFRPMILPGTRDRAFALEQPANRNVTRRLAMPGRIATRCIRAGFSSVPGPSGRW
jgi:hypothetical protein